MRDIGKNIRDLRTRKNMTQDTLAEKLFVTRQTVSNYETGKSRPDIDMLVRIAEVLEADIHHLLYGIQPSVDKEKVRHLILGGSLSALSGIAFAILLPIGSYIKAEYWLPGIIFAAYSLALPLFFLFLGWTLAQLLGMALKKEPLSAPWTKFVRWLLLGLLSFLGFITLSYLVPMLTGELQFLIATGPRFAADYIHIPQWAEYLFLNLLYRPLYAWHTPYSCAFTLPLGGLLWLVGFPHIRKGR